MERFTVYSGTVITASVAVSHDPQPSVGIAVHVQPIPVIGNSITVTTTCPKGAFISVLDAKQAKMLIDDLTTAIGALQRLDAGSPSGAVQ